MLSSKIVSFFKHQILSIVTTIDENGLPHNSCKGVVDIDSKGNVYLLDLYRNRTYENLKQNTLISVTSVDEHKFIGYCLKGEAKIMEGQKLPKRLIKSWDKLIASRLTRRLLKEVRGEKGHHRHTEALLPNPQYIIAVKVKEVVDLTPKHMRIKEEQNGIERK